MNKPASPRALRADSRGILRILDANANRCREGLRVTEDVARFLLGRAQAAALAKRLRHRVTEGVRRLPVDQALLLLSRDAEADPGRSSFARAERDRGRMADILSSNLHRAQEASRVLEEFGKPFDPRCARVFKEVRYGIYTLEKRLTEAR